MIGNAALGFSLLLFLPIWVGLLVLVVPISLFIVIHEARDISRHGVGWIRLMMYVLLALVLTWMFSSCVNQRSVNRYLRKHPEMFRTDTVRIHDTLTVKGDSFTRTVYLTRQGSKHHPGMNVDDTAGQVRGEIREGRTIIGYRYLPSSGKLELRTHVRDSVVVRQISVPVRQVKIPARGGFLSWPYGWLWLSPLWILSLYGLVAAGKRMYGRPGNY